MNQIYMAEKAAMYKLAENVAHYVVLNKKSQDRIKIQASDDADMRVLKAKLHMVYIGLYKAFILASAQLVISLYGRLQWLKNIAKHYDWAGQLEELNEQAHFVRLYRDEMESKLWQNSTKQLQTPKGKQEPRPDPKKAMGPGPRNPLHWAVALTVPEQVAFFVQNKEYPINALTPQSWTAAHLAAREGNLKILKTLLTAPGINLTIKNREERTPLHIATIHKRVGAVKLLLERHVKLLGLRDKYNRTAFIIAVEKGHVEVLKVLKAYGQDMNETTVKQGWTALHLAAETGKVDAVKWLVENGTKKFTKVRDGPQKGMTAKQIAEQKGKTKVLEFL
jgi:ankyrin repeat protein